MAEQLEGQGDKDKNNNTQTKNRIIAKEARLEMGVVESLAAAWDIAINASEHSTSFNTSY